MLGERGAVSRGKVGESCSFWSLIPFPRTYGKPEGTKLEEKKTKQLLGICKILD